MESKFLYYNHKLFVYQKVKLKNQQQQQQKTYLSKIKVKHFRKGEHSEAHFCRWWFLYPLQG